MATSHHASRQRAKKVVSDSPGLVDFAIGLYLAIFVLTARRASAAFWGNSNYRRIVINPAYQNGGLGLVDLTCGLVHTRYSLCKWQAVKLTFFTPCKITTTWLAHLGKCRTAEREVAGSNPCWTNYQDLLFVCLLFCKINNIMLMILECVVCYTFYKTSLLFLR